MKKLTLILAVVLLMSCFAGCNSNNANTPSTSNSTDNSATEQSDGKDDAFSTNFKAETTSIYADINSTITDLAALDTVTLVGSNPSHVVCVNLPENLFVENFTAATLSLEDASSEKNFLGSYSTNYYINIVSADKKDSWLSSAEVLDNTDGFIFAKNSDTSFYALAPIGDGSVYYLGMNTTIFDATEEAIAEAKAGMMELLQNTTVKALEDGATPVSTFEGVSTIYIGNVFAITDVERIDQLGEYKFTATTTSKGGVRGSFTVEVLPNYDEAKAEASEFAEFKDTKGNVIGTLSTETVYEEYYYIDEGDKIIKLTTGFLWDDVEATLNYLK